VLRGLDCLTQQHDYRFVVLAFDVCALGSYGAITLLNHVPVQLLGVFATLRKA
jgi:NO-binding membrane sensor protein with MHYT domain